MARVIFCPTNRLCSRSKRGIDIPRSSTGWGVDEDIPKGALAEEMVQAFCQAVDNADAIGIPAVNKLAEHFLVSHGDENRGTRGFVAAARYFYDAQWLPAHCELLFSWNAHVDLMNWGL
jgi:hypothetical protein